MIMIEQGREIFKPGENLKKAFHFTPLKTETQLIS